MLTKRSPDFCTVRYEFIICRPKPLASRGSGLHLCGWCVLYLVECCIVTDHCQTNGDGDVVHAFQEFQPLTSALFKNCEVF